MSKWCLYPQVLCYLKIYEPKKKKKLKKKEKRYMNQYINSHKLQRFQRIT